MFESKYNKVLTIILIIVIVAIVLLLSFLTFDYIKKVNNTKQASNFVNSFQSEIENSNSNNEIANENVTNSTTETPEENMTLNSNETQINNGSSGSSSSSENKKKYQGLTVVGTMKIPAINLEYPIVEETSTTALEKALVALYPNGDNLNQPGNTVIIGHNYRNGQFFSNLKKLSNGAKIYVTDFRGKSITYEVYNKFEALSTDASFYGRDTNGLPELTLSTCTDTNNDQRTIIFAKQI
ncbi:MAG: sortase [Clostridia bacterium]|jgi:LPXTG-site transpeptidase (sortase) family protein|nr:sortase [Clostridia bacterium]